LTPICVWEKAALETESTAFHLLARSRSSIAGLDEEFQIFAGPLVDGDSAVNLDPLADSNEEYHRSSVAHRWDSAPPVSH